MLWSVTSACCLIADILLAARAGSCSATDRDAHAATFALPHIGVYKVECKDCTFSSGEWPKKPQRNLTSYPRLSLMYSVWPWFFDS